MVDPMTPIPADDPLRAWESRLYEAKHGEATITDLYVEWHDKFGPALRALQQPAHPETSPYYDAEGNFIHHAGCSGEEHIGLPCPGDDAEAYVRSAALRADSHDGEGLDVERLARALEADWSPSWHELPIEERSGVRMVEAGWDKRELAAIIAAEYAALSKEQGRSPEGE